MLEEELKTITDAVRRAGRAVMDLYGLAEARQSTRGPVTEADLASNRILVDAIRGAFPADRILSEESSDSTDRLAASRVWVIDPLDGTKEFLARNGEFAVMVALLVDAEPRLGLVYAPAIERLYGAACGGGAWVEA
ncbi:MAG: 3'(2'),5'-bisphosphate nucleotidase CysQ family protein, partial [Longimicrobiales bacterium]